MMQPGIKSEVTQTEYAVAGDFCRIFAENTNGLYWLSFLLTADSAKAEECFVSGLEDCLEANRVFKEWAQSWARRTVIQNAIRLMRPAPDHNVLLSAWWAPQSARAEACGRSVPLPDLLRLNPFERFVFVMSVLERYSDQECKTLLRCSRQDIVWARSQAMERMAASERTSVPDVALGADRVFMQRPWIAETA